MNDKKYSIILICLAIIGSIGIPLRYYNREVKQPEEVYWNMYSEIRIEYIEDEEIYKYSNNQVLLIQYLDRIKDSSKVTNETFSEEWIYKIILGYSPFEENKGDNQTTEVLFKSQSMTINGVEYIRKNDKEFKDILNTIKSYYEKDEFIIYKKQGTMN